MIDIACAMSVEKSVFHFTFDPTNISVGNQFFQTLAKMASGLKQVFAKMKLSSPYLASDIFFKLANKYQINNTVMFNNLFFRFGQVINLVKKDQHSFKSCIDLFFLNFVVFVF
jgi:hypothetical protein